MKCHSYTRWLLGVNGTAWQQLAVQVWHGANHAAPPHSVTPALNNTVIPSPLPLVNSGIDRLCHYFLLLLFVSCT